MPTWPEGSVTLRYADAFVPGSALVQATIRDAEKGQPLGGGAEGLIMMMSDK